MLLPLPPVERWPVHALHRAQMHGCSDTHSPGKVGIASGAVDAVLQVVCYL